MNRDYSPEDHAILETEYLKDPKPDKVARANIVDRVSLGEKEVQVRDAKTSHPKISPKDRVTDPYRFGSKIAARTTDGNLDLSSRTNCSLLVRVCPIRWVILPVMITRPRNLGRRVGQRCPTSTTDRRKPDQSPGVATY